MGAAFADYEDTRRMKKLLLAAALAALACAVPATASVGPRFGVADDAGKYADDGGQTVFETLGDLGMTDNRMWIFWDDRRPLAFVEKPFLDRALPVAKERGIRVVFSVSPLRARAVTRSRLAQAQFVAFLQLLAYEYPQVRDFIVGNEPNQPRFWQPQFVSGKGASGAAYERLLAAAYDGLKAVDPEIRVIGLGLSPRGNDMPSAKSNVSTSPVRFIRDVGAAYRASGRRRPIMDAFGFHSYPRFDRDPLERGYAWPNAGITNLDRIKQAVWDAFHDTAQPTFAENGAGTDPDGRPALQFVLDEVGWQAAVPPESSSAYTGRETVRPAPEALQARIYGDIVDLVACDPAVESLLFFHLIDEHDLDRFQSGLVRADGTRKPAYFAVRDRIEALGGEDGVGCDGRPTRWRHAESVQGASAQFAPAGLVARAEEEAEYVAGVLPVSGIRLLQGVERRAIGWALSRRGLERAGVSLQRGKLRPYSRLSLRFAQRPRTPGTYVYAIRLSATMNRGRSSVLVSRPFDVR
jgi:hypothetical protein